MDKPLSGEKERKKPIPTPRKTMHEPEGEQATACLEQSPIFPTPLVETKSCEKAQANGSDGGNNTFSRRVTNVTRQIAGDIGQLVQDRKKAALEGTRQSVRRLTRRFSSASQEKYKETKIKDTEDLKGTIQMFNNIRFDSPINSDQRIYGNTEKDNDVNSSNESIDIPPPTYLPPPLPDEALYDAPSYSSSPSVISVDAGVNVQRREDYESVFFLPNYISDSDSCVNRSEESSSSRPGFARCGSWSFYDTATNSSIDQANIYSNTETPIGEERDKNKESTTVIHDHCGPIQSVELTPERNLTSSTSVETHENSIYANHDVVFRNETSETDHRATKSVIIQFDPLNESSAELSDIKFLEDLLQEDLYGNIAESYNFDEWSVSSGSEDNFIMNLPTPPLRFDSLPDENQKDEPSVKKKLMKSQSLVSSSAKSRTNWFNDIALTSSRSSTTEKKNWIKQVTQHVREKAPEVFKPIKSQENLVQRPLLDCKAVINKKGMLFKVQSGPVEDLFGEYSGRWCVLEHLSLMCYSDNTCSTVKEHFQASNILSIQLIQDAKYKYRYDNNDLHCFELNAIGKSRRGHVYGSRNISERRVWMTCIAEMLTQRFKLQITTNFIRMGWAFLREGVTGKWKGAWIILSEREFHYAIDGHSVKTLDLRKARCILMQGYQDSDNNPKTNDKGPNMLINCPNLTLYLRMWTARETKVWCHIVKLEAQNNGANLDEQQLTKNDIPVIVEKCINFIYVHGSMSEGIYRKSGTVSLISELLSKFRKDAFSVQLTKDNYTEYEVATALKRFFIELPEPLFGCDHKLYLYEVAKHNVKDEKIRMFKAALEQLPTVSYNTARKLLGHLHFLSLQSSKNLMTVENLASIWGPTLMHFEDKDEVHRSNSNHLQDAEVVNQFIKYYRYIFPEDFGELEKEKIMLKVLKKHMDSPQGAINRKTAGDFRLWIFLLNKEGKSFNVSIGPNKTAYEVCSELSDKINLPVHEITLEEVALHDRLHRPVHHTEKVLDVILKWSDWDDSDRKNNYLTCVPLSKYQEYLVENKPHLFEELKFSDNKTKTLKSFWFQISEGSLSCFKDKTSDVSIYSWRVEDIIWYIGHEEKRNTNSKWTITFLESGCKPGRTKNNPFFGNVMVWSDANDRASWLSAMLKLRYPNNLIPVPKLVSI